MAEAEELLKPFRLRYPKVSGYIDELTLGFIIIIIIIIKTVAFLVTPSEHKTSSCKGVRAKSDPFQPRQNEQVGLL